MRIQTSLVFRSSGVFFTAGGFPDEMAAYIVRFASIPFNDLLLGELMIMVHHEHPRNTFSSGQRIGRYASGSGYWCFCNRCRDNLWSWLWSNGIGEMPPVVSANVSGREWLRRG